jgi:FkbM family methyltransferase
MALAVGPSGAVLALEPNPYVFPVLEENSRLNSSKTHIVPLMFAATPEDAELDFEYSDSGFCNGGLHEGISRWKHGHAFTLRVRGRNLAAVLAREYADLLPRIRYIKVDAEGYDATVLSTLTSCDRPDASVSARRSLQSHKRAAARAPVSDDRRSRLRNPSPGR